MEDRFEQVLYLGVVGGSGVGAPRGGGGKLNGRQALLHEPRLQVVG